MFWLLFLFVTFVKLLLLPAYHSTDFEVHRNWLAITHSLPISQWYTEDRSQWTLDYPPFFAYFEWCLSKLAIYFDPEMLNLDNLNYASFKTIFFQRLSVIITDLVYVIGVKRCLSVISSEGSPRFMAGSFLFLCNVGLIFVDHIHFQYNGFLFGILLLSIAFLMQRKYLAACFVFSSLLNFKHIFLYIAPAFGAYFLKFYCIDNKSPIVNISKLIVVAGTCLAVSFGPFYNQIPQVLSRLFPFKRGLTHSYWAPNFWALYNCADKFAGIIFKVKLSESSNTGGLVQEYEHQILPSVSPLVTFILTLGFMLPCCIRLCLFTSERNSIIDLLRCVVLCACTSFMFGWHVHEKAILILIVPLSLLSLLNVRDAKSLILLSIIGHYSLFPLLFTKELILIKYSLYLAYIIGAYCVLKLLHSSLKFHVFEKLYIFGFVGLTIFEYQIQYMLGLNEKLPFLPLLLTSVYCSIGVVYFYITYYFSFLKDVKANKTKDLNTKVN